jgi:hypothetical protein
MQHVLLERRVVMQDDMTAILVHAMLLIYLPNRIIMHRWYALRERARILVLCPQTPVDRTVFVLVLLLAMEYNVVVLLGSLGKRF